MDKFHVQIWETIGDMVIEADSKYEAEQIVKNSLIKFFTSGYNGNLQITAYKIHKEIGVKNETANS